MVVERAGSLRQQRRHCFAPLTICACLPALLWSHVPPPGSPLPPSPSPPPSLPSLPSPCLQVFSSPAAALAQYLQRVFEQKVQTAVDAVLAPPQAPAAGAAGAAGALRCRLRLMAEVYGRTRALADDLQVCWLAGCVSVCVSVLCG